MQPVLQLLSKYVCDRSHPQVDPSRCINTKQHRVHCTVCEQSCPYHVLDNITKPDFTHCVDCSICASACPAGAISFSASKLKYLLEAGKKHTSVLRLGCQYSSDYSNLQLPCLAAFPFEFLAILHLQKIQTVFISGDCQNCVYCSQMFVFNKNLDQLSTFFNINKPTVLSVNDDLNRISQTRREAFSYLIKKSKHLLSSLISSLPSDFDLGDLWKILLLKQLQKSDYQSSRWLSPVINDCRGCDVCTKLCPNSALSLSEISSHKTIIHHGFKCRGCNLCAKICPWHSISSFALVEVQRPDQPSVTLIDSSSEK